MKKRILMGTLLIWAFAITVATVVAAMTLRYNTTDQRAETLRDITEALATNMEPVEDFQAEVDKLAWETGGLRISIISTEGVPLADSAVDVAEYDGFDIFSLDEMAQARENGTGFAERRSVATGKLMMFAAQRTEYGFYVRSAQEATTFWQGFAAMLPPLVLGLSVATMVTVPVAIRFANNMQRPMTELTESLNKVMAGGERLQPEHYPFEEVREMAGAINKLSDDVDAGLLQLEKEHRRLETILANMNEGFVMLDSSNTILLINDTARQIFGVTELPTGAKLREASKNQILHDAVREVKTTGQVSRVEIETADGGVFEVTVGATYPEPDPDAKGAILLLSDVSDRRSTAKLRQEFFQSASHELKTPITSIRGFAELLSNENLLAPDKRQECAERIGKEATRMQTLIEDIMMISRLESGEITYDRKRLDLHEVARDYCDDIQSIAWDYGIALSYEGESYELMASRREMEDLVGNLVSNALKYNKLGGRIEVALRKTETGAVLTVFNTGDAIPPSETQRIFERFYRLDKGRSKSLGGTGLGLAIVKHVASRYGANIEVIPHDGIGNTFKVTFRGEEG